MKPCLAISITTAAILAACGLEPVGGLPPADAVGAAEAGSPSLAGDAQVERRRWGAGPRGMSASRFEEQLARRSFEVDPSKPGADADIWSLMRIGSAPAHALGLDLLEGSYSGDQHAAIGVGGAPMDEVRSQLLEKSLWARYALARDPAEALGLAFSIARLGGRNSVPHLVAELRADDGPLQGADGAQLWTVLSMICAGGVQVSEDARDAMLEGLEAGFAPRRRESARAVARCLASSAEIFGDEDLRKVAVSRLTRMTRASDPSEARMAWRALSALGEVEGVASITFSWDANRADRWLVDLELVHALATQADGRAALVAWVEKLAAPPRDERTVHVLRAIFGELLARAETVEGLKAFAKGRAAAWTLDGAPSETDERARKIRALLRCDLAALEAVASRDIEVFETCVAEARPRIPATLERLRVDALTKISSITEGKRGAAKLVALAQASEPTTAALALSALAELDHPAVNGALRGALERRDVGILAAAAAALASRSLDTRLRDPLAIESLAKVVKLRTDVQALEGRLAALEALGRLVTPDKGKDGLKNQGLATEHEQLLREVVLPLASDGNVTVRSTARDALSSYQEFRGELAAMMPLPASSHPVPELSEILRAKGPVSRGLRVETEAGSFVVDFRGVDAPINQRHLTKLARDGFYTGLNWHRIVPGFVVQGGDPRGDGYGGPGYLVPCEYSNVTYERGAVGIATAGRDTGGSQLFVTHAATPHLDGRYTLVGFVAPEEMAVVERILPDDRILSVSAISNFDGAGPR